jgi:hypothetical protein
MKKAIFKLNVDCGRMGELEGVFISTKEKVKKLIESEIDVYFGEVLGKHSEVYGPIKNNEITFISDNEEAIKIIEKYDLTSGYNPFDYRALGHELNGEPTEDMTIDEIIDEILD